MVIRLILLSLLPIISCREQNPLVQVNGNHDTPKSLESTAILKSRGIATKSGRQRFSQDIIYAPLDDHRIITKEKIYINVNSNSLNAYEQMLKGDSPNEKIDLLFVTAPPARTTIAVKSEPLDYSTDVVVNGGSHHTRAHHQLVTTTSVPTLPKKLTTSLPLRLVTLAPVVTTPLPPFKHTKVTRTPLEPASFRPYQQQQFADQAPFTYIRFPAQSWQIPPRDSFRPTTNIYNRLFEVTPPSVAPPASPFMNPLNPPNPIPIMRNSMNLTAYPFLPIGTSNPVWNPQQGLEQEQQQRRIVFTNRVFDRQIVHKSPLRVGFSKTQEIEALPLPSPHEEFEKPLLPTNMPETDFSIDRRPPMFLKTDTDQLKKSAKTFVEKRPKFVDESKGKIGDLREYMKSHPSLVNSVEKPIQQPYRPYNMVYPPPYMVTKPMPIHPNQPTAIAPSSNIIGGPSITATAQSSGLNPNQKLDLCCRKQQVSQTCQNLCNFDSFNDKTLVQAFLTNQCPGPQLGKAFDCASTKADHSQCCASSGLATFLGGKCMPFCRTHEATPANVFDYLPCLQVFETIKNCYRQYQYSNKNIFGD